MSEILNLTKLLELDKQFKGLYKPESGCFIQHNGEAEPAYTFLLNAIVNVGNDEETLKALDRVFSPESKINLEAITAKNKIDFIHSNIEDLYQSLVERVSDIYALVNPSLHAGHLPSGFANHGLYDHVCAVALGARKEVQNWFSEMPDKVTREMDQEIEEKLAITIGVLHDMAQLFSRKLHGIGAKEVALDVVPELRTLKHGDDRKWREFARRVSIGLVLHDEPMANYRISLLRKKYLDEAQLRKENFDNVKFYDELRRKFGVAELSVFMFDKEGTSDRGRVPLRYPGIGAKELILDKHNELSLLVRLGKADKNTLEVLEFTPGLSALEEEQISNGCGDDLVVIKSNGEHRIRVSPETHALHENFGIPHLLIWFSKYLAIHSKRMKAKVHAYFALYPEAQEWNMEIRDGSSWDNDGYKSTIRVSLNRHTFESQIQELSVYGYQSENNRLENKIPDGMHILRKSVIRDVENNKNKLSSKVVEQLSSACVLNIEFQNGSKKSTLRSMKALLDLYKPRDERQKQRQT